ncbi:c-type cytochrome [bacterium]|nr:c-type cytochrome [bacterium]
MQISQALAFGGPYRAGGLVLAVMIGAILGCSSEPAKFEPNRIAMYKAELSLGTKLDPTYQVQPIEKILTETFGTPDKPDLSLWDPKKLVPDLAEERADIQTEYDEIKAELDKALKDPDLDPEDRADIEADLADVKKDLDAVDKQIAAVEGLVQLDMLQMAAGPYGSAEDGTPRGLYRQHCVHCHGITGNGAGPTAAFLNPYPRDFRLGKFKWKSTTTGAPPTHDDLKRVITNGVPGTAMPSFKLLPAEEIEALTQYVTYLSLRGELERNLILDFSDIDVAVLKPAGMQSEEEKEYVESLSADELKEEQTGLKEELAELSDPEIFLPDYLAPIVTKWAFADKNVTDVPEKPEVVLDESIVHGRDLFFKKGGCATCHGQSALGDGQTAEMFYDDWTEEYYDPKNPEHLEEFLALGALPPRKLQPRNLRLGNFRGGRRPVDVYWRIRNGIEGAKMPAAQQLTEEEIWHVVDFVRKGLPYDSLSQPPEHVQENVRVRN